MAQWTTKGKRSVFFEDPAVDHLMSMVLALGSDLWSLRERVYVLESVAESKGILLSEDVEGFELTQAQQQELADMRQEFIDRMMFVLKEEVEQLPAVAGS